MNRRRCIECNQPLLPDEHGALCSPCYFRIITDPGLADPSPPLAAEADAGHGLRWQRTPRVSETA